MLGLLLVVAPSSPLAQAEIEYVDASIEAEGDVTGWHFADVDHDGRDELFLATCPERGTRVLRRYDLDGDGYTAGERLVAPPGALAWFLDGERVALVGDGGVPTGDVIDKPSRRSFPFWPYTVGDRVIVPGTDGLDLTEFDAESGAWRAAHVFPLPADHRALRPKQDTREAGDAARERREIEARLGRTLEGDSRPFLGLGEDAAMLSSERRVQAPALVDLNGDGKVDVVQWFGRSAHVWLASDGGFPDVPTRTERVPDYVRPLDRWASLRFCDVDGRPPLDLVAVWGDRADVMDNADWRVMVLLGAADRMFPEEPHQVLRFRAGELRVGLADVDGNGDLDLSIRQFEWPSALGALTGPKFRYTHMLFLGGERRGFTRRPVLRHQTDYDSSQVRVVFAGRDLTSDCTGDGIADLVEVSLEGKLAIRQVERRTTLLGGTRWIIADEPWCALAETGSIERLDVADRNGDGLGDPVSANRSTLHVFLSRRP